VGAAVDLNDSDFTDERPFEQASDSGEAIPDSGQAIPLKSSPSRVYPCPANPHLDRPCPSVFKKATDARNHVRELHVYVDKKIPICGCGCGKKATTEASACRKPGCA
jgi:hypothetical protein